MIGKFLLDGFVIFFVCYGLLMFLHEICDAFLLSKCKNAQDVFSVLYIEKGESTLELNVRCAIQKSLVEKRVLFIVYDALSDEEVFVLWRLCDDFKHVFIAQKEDAQNALLKAQRASSEHSL